MIKKVIRYCILVPLGIIFIPFFTLAFNATGIWMSPIALYKDFLIHLRSGESFGFLD